MKRQIRQSEGQQLKQRNLKGDEYCCHWTRGGLAFDMPGLSSKGKRKICALTDIFVV